MWGKNWNDWNYRTSAMNIQSNFFSAPNTNHLNNALWNPATDGWRLADCDLTVFRSLKKKRLIASQNGQPYRVTRDGLVNLRAQLDNRTSARGW